MASAKELIRQIQQGDYDKAFEKLYGASRVEAQRQRSVIAWSALSQLWSDPSQWGC